ncbi:hypothetical protein Pint_22824 [Pistacia integerrima]|uniref:Uncharacterized protein n=1 Tax=Pistacia integerrima TaxID=434235 RepID=A0ACC0YHC2_9ROSI|nr:hypothetical protein Pint_22824 [Pistacia integerrima]
MNDCHSELWCKFSFLSRLELLQGFMPLTTIPVMLHTPQQTDEEWEKATVEDDRRSLKKQMSRMKVKDDPPSISTYVHDFCIQIF